MNKLTIVLKKAILIAGALGFSSTTYAADTYSPWFDSISKYRVTDSGLTVFVDGPPDATRTNCWGNSGESGYFLDESNPDFDRFYSALLAAYHAQESIRFIVSDLNDCVGKSVKFKFIIVGGQ